MGKKLSPKARENQRGWDRDDQDEEEFVESILDSLQRRSDLNNFRDVAILNDGEGHDSQGSVSDRTIRFKGDQPLGGIL
jgi:hypothetical protein